MGETRGEPGRTVRFFPSNYHLDTRVNPLTVDGQQELSFFRFFKINLNHDVDHLANRAKLSLNALVISKDSCLLQFAPSCILCTQYKSQK